MLLGLGYLPNRTGPAIWRDFDSAEIQDDLAHIAALGFQAVRIPLFWPDFQPLLDSINPRSLDRFGHFLQLADDNGLQVKAGLWDGMWDGAFWWPDWGVKPAPLPPHWPLIVNNQWVRWGRIRHPFEDTKMLDARELLVQELVGFYGQHPALMGWEPLPGFGRLSAAAQRTAVIDWVGSTVDMLDTAAPGLPSTFLLALDALETSNAITPCNIIEAGGQPSLSIATFASDRRRLPLNTRWIAFALDLTSTLAQRPISLHLAGLPTMPPDEPSASRDGVFYANEEVAAEHLAEVIAIAQDRECPALWLWRWADIPEERWIQPPYDHPNWRRHTGILRPDGSVKKLASALQTTISARDFSRLEFDPDEYRQDPHAHFQRLWNKYQQAVVGSR